MSVNLLRPNLAHCQDPLLRIFGHKSQSAVSHPQRFEVSHRDTAGEVCPTVKIKQSLTAGGCTEISTKHSTREWQTRNGFSPSGHNKQDITRLNESQNSENVLVHPLPGQILKE